MTNEPLLHPQTRDSLASVLANPPQGLLLVGPAGVGKATIANWLAAGILHLTPQQLAVYPHILRLAPDTGKAIGIEAVRNLEHFVSLKTPSTQNVSRLIVMGDAHVLTVEAQNALLKLLEEPPRGTVFLLTASRQEALLPTIRSRLQIIEIVPPPAAELQDALPETVNTTQIMALSGGLPGLAFALSADDQEHPLVPAAHTARELLQAGTFDRLCRVDALAKDKETTANMLYILMQMAHTALLHGGQARRWQKVLTAAYAAQDALTDSVQPKLALTDLMLNL